MNKIEKTLHRCLIDLYSEKATLTALPGYYETKSSCGYAIEAEKYCCILHPHRSSDVSLSLAGYCDYSMILDKKVSFKQFETIQEFCKILKNPHMLPVFENNDTAWDLLDQVGLKKQIVHKGDRHGRSWAVTILKNSMVFELQGSPVREVYCILNYVPTGNATIWYRNRPYHPRWIMGSFPNIVEAFKKNERCTEAWLRT